MGNAITVADQVRIKLINARKAKGLTQTQLAETLGRQQSFISNYERGQRRIDVSELVELAAALQVNLPALFSELKREAQ